MRSCQVDGGFFLRILRFKGLRLLISADIQAYRRTQPGRRGPIRLPERVWSTPWPTERGTLRAVGDGTRCAQRTIRRTVRVAPRPHASSPTPSPGPQGL